MGFLDKFKKRRTMYPENPYKEGTQKHQIYQLLVARGRAYIHEMNTPKRYGGLGVARYGARLSEIRKDLAPLGWDVVNHPKEFKYTLEEYEA